MNNLIDAIKAKISGSALESDVNGRIDLDESADMTLPRIVWFLVTGTHDKNFTEDFNDLLIQFSIFVAKTAGIAAMTTIYNDLHALFDECALPISGSTLVWMRETNLTTLLEPDTAPDGSSGIRAWHVDFELKSLAD